MVPDDLAQQRHLLSRDADEAAADASVLDQPRRDPAGSVAGDGEADALRGADDGRVDADDLGARVDERAAGVARVEGGVSLDDIVDEPAGSAAQRAAEAADNAGGDRLLETHG